MHAWLVEILDFCFFPHDVPAIKLRQELFFILHSLDIYTQQIVCNIFFHHEFWHEYMMYHAQFRSNMIDTSMELVHMCECNFFVFLGEWHEHDWSLCILEFASFFVTYEGTTVSL